MKLIPNDILFLEVESRLLQGDTVCIPLKGSSMRPLLNENTDDIILSPILQNTTLKKGDVVLFKYNGTCILHRIKKIHDDIFTLQGDSVPTCETATRKDILAKLKAIKKRGTNKITYCNSIYWKLLSEKVLAIKKIKKLIKTIIRKNK